MSLDHPRVTVLMPVWNAVRFLRPAVESVLRQSFEGFELLVIDDGSSDGTSDMLKEFSDPRIRLLTSDRQRGLVHALNAGMAQARGEYVARMDGDDISHPSRFAAQVAFLDSERDVALIGSCANVIDEKGRVVDVMQVPTSSREIYEVLPTRNVFIHPTVMFRKKAVVELGGYQAVRANVEIAQDYHLWLRLSDRHPLANLAEVLLDYRRHEGQVSKRRLIAQLQSAELARRMAARRRRKYGQATGRAAGLRLIERLRGERGSLGGECLFFYEAYRYEAYRTAEKSAIARSLAWRAVLSSPLSGRAWDRAGRELACLILKERGIRRLRAWLTRGG